jgi:gas vesicle protein
LLEFKNKELAPIINFLTALELSPKASRSRSKLVKKLLEKHEELVEDEKNLFAKYSEKDDNNSPVMTDEGNFKLLEDTKSECVREQQDLFDEYISINIDEIKEKVRFLVSKLDKLDVKFAGNDAVIYDTIMDQLEEEN